MKLLYLLFPIIFCGCSEVEHESKIVIVKEKIDPKLLSKESIPGFQFSHDELNSTIHILKNGKIILTDSIEGALDYLGYFIDDINNDGILDIRIKLADADATVENWYVQDSSMNIFTKVNGLPWIVNPIRLDSNSSYFATIDPQGCSGNIWISQLLNVDNSQISIKGKVVYDDCLEGAEQKDRSNITFYNTESNKFVLLNESQNVINSILSYYRSSQDGMSIESYWIDNIEKYN